MPKPCCTTSDIIGGFLYWRVGSDVALLYFVYVPLEFGYSLHDKLLSRRVASTVPAVKILPNIVACRFITYADKSVSDRAAIA